MQSFHYNSQTALFFGKNCVKENAATFKEYGSRAAIITGPILSGRNAEFQHPAVTDIQEALKSQDIEFILVDETEIDPSVESVQNVAGKVAAFKPDFLVAVGGGSSIDTAKATSLLLTYPEVEDPYEVFYGMGWPAFGNSKAIKAQGKLPVFAIPTTAGTGAEVTAAAVLTNTRIDNKQVMNPKEYCYAAFLDSRYVKDSPMFLIHTGVIDALAHGIESVLCTKNNPMTQMFANFGFDLFRGFKDHMISGELTEEDFDNMQLAAFIQGIALMQSSTTLPHGMGYPLSHHYQVNHGLSCGIFLGEYVRGFKDQSLVQPIVERCGFKDSDEFAAFCKSITEDDVHIEVSEQEIIDWSKMFVEQMPWRIAINLEPATVEDIEALYRKSLAKYIKK